jgi:hypothetical protein
MTDAKIKAFFSPKAATPAPAAPAAVTPKPRKEAKVPTPKTPATPDLNVADIDLFFATSSRGDNDEANKRRERFLVTLASAPEQPDNERFALLQAEWKKAIDSIKPEEAFTHYTVKQMAGRLYNYDYKITFFNGAAAIVERKVEFKFNAAEITGLPQFLSMPAAGIPMEMTYAQFYFENYLAKYLATDAGITAEVPTLEVYLAGVHNSNYDAHPLFRQMYDREETAKKEKAAVVNESIKEYLNKYGPAIDKAALSDILWKRQEGKKFFLWDLKAMHVREFTKEELTITEVVGIVLENTLIVRSANRTFRLLLRWKNHKGVLYPAWQIKLE